jgi:hypothetical protein
MELRDTNGDGLPDLAGTLTMDGRSGLTFWPGHGDGTFGEATSYANPGLLVRQMASGDVDGDGEEEYLLARAGAGLHMVDPYEDKIRELDDRPCGAVACYDWTGDGVSDILYLPQIEEDPKRTQAVMLKGRSDGLPVRHGTWPIDAELQVTLLGAKDAESPDVAIADVDRIHVLRWTGKTFGPAIPINPAGMILTDADIRSGDINGDGHADIVLRNHRARRVWVFYLDEDRLLTNSLEINVGRGSAVGVGDVDGDGIDDLVVPDHDGVYLHAGRGEQPPADPVLVWPSVGVPSLDIEIVDMNGDGRLDIAAFLLNIQFNQPPAQSLTTLINQPD